MRQRPFLEGIDCREHSGQPSKPYFNFAANFNIEASDTTPVSVPVNHPVVVRCRYRRDAGRLSRISSMPASACVCRGMGMRCRSIVTPINVDQRRSTLKPLKILRFPIEGELPTQVFGDQQFSVDRGDWIRLG